jgi:PIN domain nuclease of toxin-antitoxin system
MTILDAQAVLAFLRDEPAADEVERLMPDGGLPMTGVAEVIDHLVQNLGLDEDEAAIELATLTLAPPPPVDADLMVRVGLLRARHHDSRARDVSLADCVAAETARTEGTDLATADRHLLDLCVDEAIAVRPLPDSQGRTWTPPAGLS